MPLPANEITVLHPVKACNPKSALHTSHASSALHNFGDVNQSGVCPCPTSHGELGVDGVGKPQEENEHIGVL